MSEPVFLPLMTIDQPDTAERKRREVQAIPFALPTKRVRVKWNALDDWVVWPPLPEGRDPWR